MANDDKYGRIFPERAVAPIRDLVTAQLDILRTGLDTDESLTQEYEAALEALDDLGFPKNEPILTLRGQDLLAAPTVRRYADAVAISDAFGGRGSKEQMAMLKHLRGFANRMEYWQPRKLPD